MSEEQQQATIQVVKQIIRRKKRRHPRHEENFLNIYPMMDMMTILLVFLIMQFATAAAAIQQSDVLQIPYSTSKADLQQATQIQISRNEIVVDGKHCLALRNGQVDPSQKQGGGTGFLITPLFQEMARVRDLAKLIAQKNPNRPFKGQVQIIGDKRIPFRTLSELLYTLGQSEFKELHFVVNKKS